jgi:hypothetical protein
MTVRVASCSCGQLQVSYQGAPQKVSLCHWRECQRRTGSTYERPSDSGFSIAFYFCPHCGSTVYWEPRRKLDAIAVAVVRSAPPAFPPRRKRSGLNAAIRG